MTKVSIIIPTYNRSEMLKRSIQSVLGQTYRDFEIVVVDDGSSDNTKEVATSFGEPVKYIYQQNAGASAARNLGALNATGEYVMFLDSDDTIETTAIEKLAGALDENPDFGAACCGWNTIKKDCPEPIGSDLDKPSGDVFAQICTEHFCLVHSVIVRRKCLAKSGLFDTELSHYEDIDFWCRVAAYYKFKFVPDHLVNYYRDHVGASAEPARLALSRDYILNKLIVYRRTGRMSINVWRTVRRRIHENYSNSCAIIALRALDEGSYRKALGYSILAFIYRPETLRRRGRIAPFLKALWLTITRPFPSGNASR